MSEEKQEGPRSFCRFFEQIAGGEAEAEATAKLHKLMTTCRDEGINKDSKVKGTITITVGFEVDAGQKETFVQTSYKVALKEPEPARAGDMFFMTKGGNLTVERPRQQKLPLREVTEKQESPRVVEAQQEVKAL